MTGFARPASLMRPMALAAIAALGWGCAAPDTSTRYLGEGPVNHATGDNPHLDYFNRQIAAEPKGSYFVGRRYYKDKYKFWGYVRESGQPWKTAKLVMLNENLVLAPDRSANRLGFDDGYEYRLDGFFTGDTIYEPSSNGFYPEFVLKNIQLLNANPFSIYKDGDRNVPELNIIQRPQ